VKQGTTYGGLSEIARRTYVVGDTLALVAYRNSPDSLGLSNIQTDLIQPALSGGYSPIQLNGQWSVVNGLSSYVHPGGGDPGWQVTASWGVTVTGIAIVYGSILVHFKDLVAPFDGTLLTNRLNVNVSTLVNSV
jgi:hypothetical protein